MKQRITTLALLLVTFTIVAQNSIKITADYDAAIGYHDNYNTAGNNYGTALQNAAYVLPGAQGGLNVNRALIHFNLSLIPTNAYIVSAKLNLYALGTSGTLQGHEGTSNEGLITRVIESWNENTVTWNNQPKTDSLHGKILSASTSPTQDYLEVDITDMVKLMQISNHGILIKQKNNLVAKALLFASLNTSDSTKFPSLVIEYNIQI